MDRRKSRKGFIINTVASGAVLIVFVLCAIWINTAAVHRVLGNEGQQGEMEPSFSEGLINGEKENAPEVGAKPEPAPVPETPAVGKGQEGMESGSSTGVSGTPAVSDGKTEVMDTEVPKSSKPLVVPQEVPEGEAFAVFNNTLIIGDSRTEGFKLYSGVKNASYFCMKSMTIDKIIEGKKYP